MVGGVRAQPHPRGPLGFFTGATLVAGAPNTADPLTVSSLPGAWGAVLHGDDDPSWPRALQHTQNNSPDPRDLEGVQTRARCVHRALCIVADALHGCTRPASLPTVLASRSGCRSCSSLQTLAESPRAISVSLAAHTMPQLRLFPAGTQLPAYHDLAGWLLHGLVSTSSR